MRYQTDWHTDPFGWLDIECYTFWEWVKSLITTFPYKLIMYYEMIQVWLGLRDDIDPFNEILAITEDLSCWKDMDLDKLVELDPTIIHDMYR